MEKWLSNIITTLYQSVQKLKLLIDTHWKFDDTLIESWVLKLFLSNYIWKLDSSKIFLIDQNNIKTWH